MASSSIYNWYMARKAAGQKVQPWEYEAAEKAKLESLSDVKKSNRANDISQATLDAQKAYNDALLEQEEKDREAAEKAGKTQLAGQLTTAGTGYLLREGKGTPKTGLNTVSAINPATSKGMTAAEYVNSIGPNATAEQKEVAQILWDLEANAAHNEAMGASAGMAGETTSGISGQGMNAPYQYPGSSPLSSSPPITDVSGAEPMVTGPGMGGGTTTATGMETSSTVAPSGGPGVSVGSTGTLGVAPVVGAILGAFATREYGKKWKDETGVKGYLGKSSQHPLAALGPGTELVDTGIIDKDTAIGKFASIPAKIEEATAGKIADFFSKACIIVTACTSEDSHAVDITRRYRDKYLSKEQLRGYYIIAEKVVPYINRFSFVKWFVKRFLVDKLVEYGKYKVDCGLYPSPSSILVTRTFLKLCQKMGEKQAVFVRCNGEVV